MLVFVFAPLLWDGMLHQKQARMRTAVTCKRAHLLLRRHQRRVARGSVSHTLVMGSGLPTSWQRCSRLRSTVTPLAWRGERVDGRSQQLQLQLRSGGPCPVCMSVTQGTGPTSLLTAGRETCMQQHYPKLNHGFVSWMTHCYAGASLIHKCACPACRCVVAMLGTCARGSRSTRATTRQASGSEVVGCSFQRSRRQLVLSMPAHARTSGACTCVYRRVHGLHHCFPCVQPYRTS